MLNEQINKESNGLCIVLAMLAILGKLRKRLSDLSPAGTSCIPRRSIALRRICPIYSAFFRSKPNWRPRKYAPPTLLNEDLWRYVEEPDRWEPLATEPVWNESCFQSLLMKILNKKQLLHFSC